MFVVIEKVRKNKKKMKTERRGRMGERKMKVIEENMAMLPLERKKFLFLPIFPKNVFFLTKHKEAYN